MAGQQLLPAPPLGPVPASAYQTALMHCVMSGAKSFDGLFAFADFAGGVETGKSSACVPVTWGGGAGGKGGSSAILLFSVYKDRWRSDDNASLRRRELAWLSVTSYLPSSLPARARRHAAHAAHAAHT